MIANPWVMAILVWGLGFRSAIAYFLQPGFDEAYYYLYTLNPSLSYFDHPPLVAWTTGFGIWLTGSVSQFTIRLGTVLLYTATLYFFYRASRQLFGEKTATLTLAIATTIPFFQIGFGILTLPDSPLMFFWAASLYLSALEFFPIPNNPDSETSSYSPSWRLALLGLLVGGAFLGKYHGLLLGIGILFFGLFSPNHRQIFGSKWLYLGMLIFAIAISPVWIWNLQHNWVSFRFQSARAVPQSGYRFGDLLVTFLVGVGYLFPTFGLPLWWISLTKTWQLIRPKSVKLFQSLDLQKHLFILSVSLPIFLGFTLMGGYRQILPGWPMPGFFGATLILGNQMAIAQAKNPKRLRNWLWGSGIAIITLLTIALLHITSGLFQKDGNQALFGGIYPAKYDDSTQMLDIQQLRQGFTNSPTLMQELQQADFVFSNNFFLAGQVAMAIAPLGKPITAFDTDPRGFAFWSEANDYLGKNAIYITSELFKNTDGKNLNELAGLGETAIAQKLLPLLVENKIEATAVYQELFQSLSKISDINIQRGGEIVQIFHIYRATKQLKIYPRPYGN